jgi:hypothetical protein
MNLVAMLEHLSRPDLALIYVFRAAYEVEDQRRRASYTQHRAVQATITKLERDSEPASKPRTLLTRKDFPSILNLTSNDPLLGKMDRQLYPELMSRKLAEEEPIHQEKSRDQRHSTASDEKAGRDVYGRYRLRRDSIG